MYLPSVFRFWSVLAVLALPLVSLATTPAPSLAEELASSPALEAKWGDGGDRQKDEPPVPGDNGGGRGGICLLAPIQLPGVTRVWSDRPLFLWRGPIRKLEVVDAGGAVIWEAPNWEDLGANTYSRLYEGPPLDPETTYVWRVYSLREPDPVFAIPFQRLGATDAQQVAAALADVDVSVDGAAIAEEDRPLAYVSFFMEQNLSAEALRVAFTAPPSAAVQQYQQRVLDTCSGL